MEILGSESSLSGTHKHRQWIIFNFVLRRDFLEAKGNIEEAVHTP